MGNETELGGEYAGKKEESLLKRAVKSKVAQLAVFITLMTVLANVDVKKIAANLGFTKAEGAYSSQNAVEIGLNQDEFYVQVGQYINKTKLNAASYTQGLQKLVDLRRQINATLPGKTLADEVNTDLREMPAEYVEQTTLARLVHYAADKDVFNAKGDKYLAERFAENYQKETGGLENAIQPTEGK